ncbi:MAG: hypothetical protein DI546_09455 [Rhizobium sp.]|nr:MAG: hypothetical protein DI546_09455 [Rhizobium sp.]
MDCLLIAVHFDAVRFQQRGMLFTRKRRIAATVYGVGAYFEIQVTAKILGIKERCRFTPHIKPVHHFSVDHPPDENDFACLVLVSDPTIRLKLDRLADEESARKIVAKEYKLSPLDFSAGLPDPPRMQRISDAVFRGIDAKG